MKTVRTRIAPSPTGYPHIGTIYQALFDYAYAKKNGGKFIIRIEDTDRTRFVEDAEDKIYQALDWFGISEDESPRKGGEYGPYRQSERLKIYQKYASVLIEQGQAYYCFCSKERLEEMRVLQQKEGKPPMYDKYCRNLKKANVEKFLKENKAYVVRLMVPKNQTIKIRDEIRGEILFDSNVVDDQVLLKADGYPTYHLAVVVDDHLMKISHIVRGEEWLSSAPKHFLLYDYFGWEKPLFIHTPILRNPDKSKFSKRQGHTNVSWYQEQGYIPEAILNYLALMGWSHPAGIDIFSLDEFIGEVELNKLSPVGPIFDLRKLEWMNGEYIRKNPLSAVESRIYDFFHGRYSKQEIGESLPLIQDRLKRLTQWEELTDFFRARPTNYEETPDKNILKELIPILRDCGWQKEKMEEKIRNTAQKLNIKAGQAFMALRDAITGKKATPPILETMIVLGKEESFARLEEALKISA
jgi:glutamyl-tRNA synthetase